MNVKVAKVAIHLLDKKIATSNSIQLRIARRWLQANMKLEYDYMVRLQTLEGVANVHVGTWWQKGKQGLLRAKDFFADKQAEIQPVWFDTAYTGMYGILEKMAATVLSQHRKVQMEPSEIITNALMGMGTGDPTADRIATIWHAGRGVLQKGVLSGKETPETAAKGVVGRGILQQVLGQAKRVRLETGMPTDDEGKPLDSTTFRDWQKPKIGPVKEDTDDDEDSPVKRRNYIQDWDVFQDEKQGPEAVEYMIHLLFKGNDPLAKKIQSLMKEAFAPSRPMMIWLGTIKGTLDMGEVRANWIEKKMGQTDVEGTPDEFQATYERWGKEFDALGVELKKGEFPSAVDVSAVAGIFKQDFSQKHFKPAWERFFKLLWSNARLKSELAQQMDAAGIDNPEMLDPEVILRELEEQASSKRKKVATSVAQLFRLRQALSKLPMRLFVA